MNAREQAEATWRKSSYSGTGNGDCVEVAFAQERTAVRDSKDDAGVPLSFTPQAWRAFLVAMDAH
jgi:hypothetical protein